MQDVLPIGFLLLVPAWLWLHYYFMPSHSSLQLNELRGTWFRVVLAVIFAACLGRMALIYPKMLVGIFIGLALLPISSGLMYLYDAILRQHWIFDFRWPFKTKVGGVYFVSWITLLGFGILSYQLSSRVCSIKLNTKFYGLVFLGVLLIAIGAINFLAYHALNGVLLFFGSAVIFILLCIKMLFNPDTQSKSIRGIFLLLILLLSIGAFGAYWNFDKQSGHKLTHLLADARVAIQIDREKTWQRSIAVAGQPEPINELGTAVNGSTYERLAWFTKGLSYVVENPLGLGYSHKAFNQLMAQDYPGSIAPMTHSGWLDFTLGVGLPGLLFTWLVFLAIFRMAYRASIVDLKSPWPSVCLWMLGGVWFLWFPGELSEREYIEHLFFMLALMVTSLNQQPLTK